MSKFVFGHNSIQIRINMHRRRLKQSGLFFMNKQKAVYARENISLGEPIRSRAGKI